MAGVSDVTTGRRRLYAALLLAGLITVPTMVITPDVAHCAQLQRVVKSDEEPAPQPAKSPSGLDQRPDIPPPPAEPEVTTPEADSTDETLREPPQIPEQPPPPTSEPPTAGAADEQPFPPEPTGDKVIFQADDFHYEAGAIIGEGNVVLRMEDMTVYADVVEIDKDGEQAMVHGNLRIETPDQTSRGERLLVDLEDEEWELHEGRTRIEPEFFDAGQVQEPLYLEGKQIVSHPGGDLVELFEGQFTSCDLKRPHYALRSRHVELRQGDKVVLEKPSINLLGHGLIRLPFNVVLSLEENNNRVLPEIGQNPVEGYYAKFAYLYLAGQAASGLVKLNLTQSRGVGLGLTHYIDSDRQRGQGSVFFEPSQGALTSRILHEYQLTPQLSSNLRASYQQNSGYFGTSASDSVDLTLNRRVTSADSELSLRRSASASAYTTSRQYVANFRHQQRLGPQSRWSLRTNASRRSYSFGEVPDDELDAEFDYYHSGERFDWQLRADNRYDLDGATYTGDNYFALNRLPELTINTDTRRLNDYELLGRVPFRSTLQLGSYQQEPDDIRVGRAAIDTRFGGGERRISDRLRLNMSGRYLQAFYDEGSALYITSFNATARQQWGGDWATRLRYGYQDRRGYAPLRLDYAGRSHSLYWEAAQLRPDRSRIFLSSGYDFISDRWRDVLLRTEYMPSASSKLELQSGYSLQRTRWRPLSLRWRQVAPNDHLYLTAGTEYDLDRSQLTRATMELDWRWHRWWRIELLTGYSGYRNDFSTLDIQLTRELHCLVASVAYSKSLHEFRFNLGIKAFPSPERILGVGRSGALFQSGSGQYF